MKHINYTFNCKEKHNRSMFMTVFDDGTVFVNCSALAALDNIEDDLRLRDECNAIVIALSNIDKLDKSVTADAVISYLVHRGYIVTKTERMR